MSKIDCNSAESCSHRFDYYIKLCIKHRIQTAFRDYRNNLNKIHGIPWEDIIENTVGRYDKYPCEEVTVQIGKFSVDFCDPRLNKMLQKLPERFQNVVILRIIYEMSYEEIAEYLKVSHSTVRDYKSRGICLLRKYLKESGNEKEQEQGRISR